MGDEVAGISVYIRSLTPGKSVETPRGNAEGSQTLGCSNYELVDASAHLVLRIFRSLLLFVYIVGYGHATGSIIGADQGLNPLTRAAVFRSSRIEPNVIRGPEANSMKHRCRSGRFALEGMPNIGIIPQIDNEPVSHAVQSVENETIRLD